MIAGDIVFFSAAGLLGPIFALFVQDFITGGGPEVVGISIAIYLVTKSVCQIPAAALMDKIRGEYDDFCFLIVGLSVSALAALCYLFIHTPLQLYILQFVQGLALAFSFPSFYALFTRHAPRGKEATVWSVYYTLFDLASAGAAALGGYLASTFGFHVVIITVAAAQICGILFTLQMRTRLRLLSGH